MATQTLKVTGWFLAVTYDSHSYANTDIKMVKKISDTPWVYLSGKYNTIFFFKLWICCSAKTQSDASVTYS